MTQEEKLEEAKRLYKTANADQKYVLERLFPELKESEDEKIRKELLDFCKNRAEYYPNDPKYKNISAWIAWLEKKGEQKLTEWSEIDKANLEDSIYFVKEFRRSNLCDNESRLQNSRTCIEWLASLKDRVLPQPKQGWSEEDKKYLNNLYRIIYSYRENTSNETDKSRADGCERWLNSLRPQNTWKPSDSQIECLSDAIKRYNSQGYTAPVLKELLEQLKKLREK